MSLYVPHVHFIRASYIVGLVIKLNNLQYTRLYVKIVEAKILFGQRLRCIDSWFSYKWVQSWAAIHSSYASLVELSRPHQRYNINWAWRVDPTPRSDPTLSRYKALYWWQVKILLQLEVDPQSNTCGSSICAFCFTLNYHSIVMLD